MSEKVVDATGQALALRLLRGGAWPTRDSEAACQGQGAEACGEERQASGAARGHAARCPGLRACGPERRLVRPAARVASAAHELFLSGSVSGLTTRAEPPGNKWVRRTEGFAPAT